MNIQNFHTLIYIWMALAAIVFLVLLKITAPYGRHTTSKWGPQINNRLGWILMEIPALVIIFFYMTTSYSNQNTVTWILVVLFIFHYLNRTFIFPFRIQTKGKNMPVVIVSFGFLFNLVNGFLIGYYFASFAEYEINYLWSPQFITGILLFLFGVYINWKYDNRLINLRQPGETNYLIPKGGLFNHISCPNLFGEIIEWLGFAILCWNLPAVSFFVWTIANLVPRAISHHKWYKQKFEDYPTQRKAVFPRVL